MRHTINSRRPPHIYPDCSVLFLVALSSAFYDYYNRKLRKRSKNFPTFHPPLTVSSSSSWNIYIQKTHHKSSSGAHSFSHLRCWHRKKSFSSQVESVRGENEIYAIECTIIIAISYSASFSGPCLVAAVLWKASTRTSREATRETKAAALDCVWQFVVVLCFWQIFPSSNDDDTHHSLIRVWAGGQSTAVRHKCCWIIFISTTMSFSAGNFSLFCRFSLTESTSTRSVHSSCHDDEIRASLTTLKLFLSLICFNVLRYTTYTYVVDFLFAFRLVIVRILCEVFDFFQMIVELAHAFFCVSSRLITTIWEHLQVCKLQEFE